MTTASETTYWFYQLTSAGEFDSIAQSQRLPLGTVPLGASELNAGDVVFIWLGGNESGLKGWGVVSADPISTVSSKPPLGFRLHRVRVAPSAANANSTRGPGLVPRAI